jgi:uncharacterized protein VirK/YbjX
MLPLTPFRLFVWAMRALLHIKHVRQVLNFVARVPAFSQFVQANPRFAFKFLTGEYLARGLSISACATCFLHHYRRLHQVLPGHLLREILYEEIVLHTFPQQNGRFTLTLGLSRPYDIEGELSLRLRVDGDIVFVLAFTIVPGSVFGSRAEEVFLISRIQGIKGRSRQIGEATRALQEVAPARLLLAALQGIGEAFRIRHLVALPADRQISYKEDADLDFRRSYDEFFAGLGLPLDHAGFFSSVMPLAEKPLASIQRSHRSRARKRRAFKLQLQAACATLLQSFLVHRDSERPAPARHAAPVLPWPVSLPAQDTAMPHPATPRQA